MDLEVLGSSPRGGTILRPVVVGGGAAVGLTLALRLREAGHPVTLFDPAPLGRNASGVAAGMLAAGSEAFGSDASTFAHLRYARELWTPLAARICVDLDRSGAVHLVGLGHGQARAAALSALGSEAFCAPVPSWVEDARQGGWDAVSTAEDWRLDPLDALASLRRAFLAAGGEWRSEALPSPAQIDRGTLIVVASGWDTRALVDMAPEAAWLSPIKGQILRLAGGPREGPVVRVGDVYLAPDRDGLIVGATMEVGVSDTRVELPQTARLQAAAAEVSPRLGALAARAQAGVRAATPDGWPLVGPSKRQGVWLAVGARRNGWLLAPLIAEVLMSRMRGEDAGEIGRMMDPGRFG